MLCHTVVGQGQPWTAVWNFSPTLYHHGFVVGIISFFSLGCGVFTQRNLNLAQKELSVRITFVLGATLCPKMLILCLKRSENMYFCFAFGKLHNIFVFWLYLFVNLLLSVWFRVLWRLETDTSGCVVLCVCDVCIYVRIAGAGNYYSVPIGCPKYPHATNYAQPYTHSPRHSAAPHPPATKWPSCNK